MPAPEMIRFLTKKFSTHNLREVKPGPTASDHLKLQGHSPGADEIKDRSDAGAPERWSVESPGSLIEEDFEDEEISTINLSQGSEVKPPPPPLLKYSPKSMEQEAGPSTSTRFQHSEQQRVKQHSLRHVTPPLKQFEMRLPDIEVERKHPVTIKPKKCTVRGHKQFLKSLESHSNRRPAFPDFTKDSSRPSAFVRIPHIEVAKIHPRSEKSSQSRSSKDIVSDKNSVSKVKPVPSTMRDIPRKDKSVSVVEETSHSDSEISECTESNLKTSSISRTGSFTGKKSPTLSFHERVHSEIPPPTLRIGTLTRHSPFGERISPPLTRISPQPRDQLTTRDIANELSRDMQITRDPSREFHRDLPLPRESSRELLMPRDLPLPRDTSRELQVPRDTSRDFSRDLQFLREGPREFLRDVNPREPIREQNTPSPRFEYKCFKTLSSSYDNEKLSATLVDNLGKRFKPIISSKEIIRRDDSSRKSNNSLDKFFIERYKEGSRSPNHKLNIERVSIRDTNTRGSWDKTDVEMTESGADEDRHAWHRDRLNNELKRKHSVLPVDEEVRSICGASPSSNFKAFVLTSNPSQSGPNHRTIDISVMQPNKRVCCTDSPPSLRRPSINVEKMAQAVLVRRPVVRKAGNPSIVWSTKEDLVRPVPQRPPTSSPILHSASMGG